MTLSHGFRQLANVIETLEADGLDVLDVATTDDDPDDGLTVDLTVSVPLDDAEPATGSTAADGDDAGISAANADRTEQAATGARERVLDPLAVRADETNGASAVKPASPEPNAEADDPAATEGGDEVVVDCPVSDCDATFESDHGMKIHRTKVHGDETDGTDEGTPTYRDPERLREVYDDCDSFPEMRDALETDVSTQTVRRQMIAHDIYEPGESAAGSDSGPEASEDDEEETDGNEISDEDAAEAGSSDDGDADEAASEGEAEPADEESELEAIELPEGVSVADLKAAVTSSQTLYDVQQRFDLDRKAAMQLLETYDLLELVHGRVSHRDARKQVDEDEITRRILEHAPVSQRSGA